MSGSDRSRNVKEPAGSGGVADNHLSLQGVHGSVALPGHRAGFWRQWRAFSGPAVLVSVGYMDPGNWGTDLAGGAQFKYGSAVGGGGGQPDGDFHAGHRRPAGRGHRQGSGPMLPRLVSALDALAQLAAVRMAIGACDLAEVLGSAVALNLLFHIPLLWAVIITALRRAAAAGACSGSACGPSRPSCWCWWPPSPFAISSRFSCCRRPSPAFWKWAGPCSPPAFARRA